MVGTMFRIERTVIKLERFVIFLAFIGLVFALFLQVIFRFVIQNPLDSTEELSRVLIIWLVFVSSANGISRAEHFVVDFVVNFFPQRLSNAVAYVIDAVCLVFILAAALISYQTALGGSGQTMPALRVSIIVQTLAMPVGFTLMFFHAIVLVLRRQHIGDPGAYADPVQAPRAEPEGGL